ncbi:(d)CMP kinase [Bacillus sp. FJAT-45350]|uniref:(d)CMP kinase n=1 Tax=Bacillus sp. FJAT-45350 TaxID=2011014 RepID=UPI000BB71170|nr:(d)CMP kinase [Bacillus sp. FJAT-45350]
MSKRINIAIDGPAGAGKSTVAKEVAKKLEYVYIDTGAMYRAITYQALESQINLEDEATFKPLLDEIVIKLTTKGVTADVFINDVNVTEEIRLTDVTNNVSLVASHKVVRDAMLIQQRQLASVGGAVMDGRDIGTHVLPDAELKVFLNATVDERARRRHEENLEKGYQSDLEQLKKDIALRDEKDSNREIAPLRKAEDAIEIDSTSMSIVDVVQTILQLAEKRK